MSVLTVSDTTGLLKKAQYLLPEILFILCSIVIFTDANLADNLLKETSVSPSQAPLVAPAIPDLPLPANLPLFRRSRRKHLLPHGAPAHPPFFGPLITSRQPPTSSSLSKPLMKRSALEPPSAGLANISPAQFSTGTVPSGLAEPPLSPDSSDCCKPDTVLKRASHGCHCVYPIKLDLVLLNVSQNPNWNLFLEELASQLGLRVSQIELINYYVLSLSQLNISMDVTPHSGISFSASDASAINFSLTTHKVHFDSTLVGDYKLLNFTWFEPPAPSQAPLASSPPMKAPTHRASPSSPSSTSNKGKHSNLILIFGIGTSLLITAIISVLIICSCAFRGRKSKASPKETAKPRLLLLLFVLSTVSIGWVNSHEESGKWSCESDSEIRVLAEFKPGLITLDGHADDWEDIDGSEFSLLPALDPHAEHEYKGGKMNVKALHDGHDVYFLLQVDGEYVYSKGENTRCPSIALMFQIGEDATYHNMGGCKEGTGSCTSKTCKGHEVDIMHFSIGSAIPGRLYGGNPIDNSEGNGGDRFGHLVDVYAWTPHCRYLDGMGPSGNDSSAQNDWKGAWWHSSFSVHSGFVEEDSPYASGGQKGTYYFEFSRPLRTMDHIQQDVQFKIGESSKLSVAFWYPVDRNPWHGSGHYTINCDWVPLDISSGSSLLTKSAPGSSGGSTASVFALLLSVVSLCVSVFVGYRVIKPNSVPFTPMENL